MWELCTALLYAFFFLFFWSNEVVERFPDTNMSAERLLSWQLYKNYVYNSDTKSDNVSTSEDMFSFVPEEEKNSSLRQLSNSSSLTNSIRSVLLCFNNHLIMFR